MPSLARRSQAVHGEFLKSIPAHLNMIEVREAVISEDFYAQAVLKPSKLLIAVLGWNQEHAIMTLFSETSLDELQD